MRCLFGHDWNKKFVGTAVAEFNGIFGAHEEGCTIYYEKCKRCGAEKAYIKTISDTKPIEVDYLRGYGYI